MIKHLFLTRLPQVIWTGGQVTYCLSARRANFPNGKFGFILFAFTSCAEVKNKDVSIKKVTEGENVNTMLDTATFGAGCFWCVEAVFQELDGVQSVISGYSGGNIDSPTYDQICSGKTGHAEVCQIYYDKTKISYEELLQAFWKSHDPTTLNRQGADVGNQYRSVIFYHDENQRQLAENYKQKLNVAKVFDKPIVTEISQFVKFFLAEEYHQNYYQENPNKPYCLFVVLPKLEKFRKVFKEKLKKVSLTHYSLMFIFALQNLS